MQRTPPLMDRLPRILQSQVRRFWLDPDPCLILSAIDLRVWHFLVGRLGPPYAGGEYIFRLTAPDDFPASPPRLEFLTPNGVFIPGGPVCVSVGEFHARDAPGAEGAYGWRPTLGMGGFAAQVVSALVCPEGLEGIRITTTTDAEKTRLASASRAYNATHFPTLADEFDALIAGTPPDSRWRECKAEQLPAAQGS